MVSPKIASIATVSLISDGRYVSPAYDGRSVRRTRSVASSSRRLLYTGHSITKSYRLAGVSSLFLEFSNGILTARPQTTHASLKLHMINIPRSGDGHVVVIESQEGDYFLSRNASGVAGVTKTEENGLSTVTSTDDRLFHIQPSDNIRYKRIKHYQSGLFLSAMSSGVSLVSQPDATTDFEEY